MRCLLLLATCAATACFAHESPEHRVAELSSEMALAGKSGSALMQRAIEYRALGALDEAAGDLEAVLQLEPQSLDALKTLSEIQSEQGKTGLALQTIGRAIRLNPQDASLYFTRAVIYGGDGKDEAALADCERAFAAHKGDLEWYLTRAQLQSRLGRFNECIAGLNEGLKLTGSAVLNVELIEALIDARKYHEALARIEPELKDTRLRSAWLLRRARVRLGLGKNSAAKEDLSAALEELNQRISSPRAGCDVARRARDGSRPFAATPCGSQRPGPCPPGRRRTVAGLAAGTIARASASRLLPIREKQFFAPS
jgi:tetratricopeptide (TPR) repeat protein